MTWCRGTALPIAIAMVVVAAVLVAAPAAKGDIVVVGVDPPRGEPGEIVDLRVGCGGCPRRGLRLPVSLVPMAERPLPERCGHNALCSPRATEPPSDPPFTNLGRTNRAGHLRFTVPNASPGAYAFVIFCASCYSGEGGSLIVNDRPGDLLQIRRNDHGLAGGFGRAMRAILTTAPRLVAFLLP
jgi:hypothetical protein